MSNYNTKWTNSNVAALATLCTAFSVALGMYISTPSSELSNDNKTIEQKIVTNTTPQKDIEISLIGPSEEMTQTKSTAKHPRADAMVGMGSGLWNWTPDADHHKAVVEISTTHGSGTGVLISVNKDKPVKDGYEGFCVTAWHVVQDDAIDGKIKATYQNKRRAKGCKVVQYNEAKDVALLWVWVPNDVEPAKLATQGAKHGDKLEFVGLGGSTGLDFARHFHAAASPPSTIEKIFADTPLLPGDSGGPVFNAQHEVVGIISGGWFWWDSGLKTKDGIYIRTTWPARASNVGPLQTMITKQNEKNKPKATNPAQKELGL